MTCQQGSPFVWALLSLLTLAACRDSRTQTPATPLALKNQAGNPQAVVKVLEVKPAVSFDAGQLPQGNPQEFQLSATVGQFLLMRVKDANLGRETGYSIRVRPPNGDLTSLQPSREGGRCSGSWLYRLPQTGVYRIVFDPAGVKHGIDFALLPADNSIVDPGIKPEHISVDFRGFAGKQQMALVPYEQGDACDIGDLQAPAHLAVEYKGFEFRVMPLEGLKQLWGAEESIAYLQASLRSGRTEVDAKDLPYPWSDDAATVMTARQAILKGPGWRGLRWIAGYAQDGDYPGSLGYVFEGISDDGRYFILVRASVSHPQHRNALSAVTAANSKGMPSDTEMRRRLEEKLAAASPVSFKPNLDQLDSIIESLRFQP